jgi:glutathione S-transferase
MADLVLHSYRRCPFAIRVRMTLEEKRIAYQVIEENLAELEGQVPVLVHDGQTLQESAIITEYLEELFPEPRLMPESPMQRAQLRLWTKWCDLKLKPDLDAYKYELPKLPENEQNLLVAKIHAHVTRLEDVLKESSYLLGEVFTLADIHLFPFYRQLTRAHPKRTDFTGFPHLNRWLESITGRASFKKVMEKNWPT